PSYQSREEIVSLLERNLYIDTNQYVLHHGEDVLKLGEGIHPEDLVLTREGMNLVIQTGGEGNQITIKDWYEGNRLSRIEFADGTLWNEEYIEMELKKGTHKNDRTLGSVGNDYLEGSYGNDTYLFGIGHGQDIIYDYDPTTGNMDTIQFDANTMDLIFSRENNDLQIAIQGTDDNLKVQSWFSGNAYQTEVLKTADGNLLLNAQVEQLIQAMASFTGTAGMSWNQALHDKPEEVSQLLGQYWKSQNEIVG
ncbi:MAG TPA: hypothetical protein GX497_00445, partial [Bacillus bacterium]|nr:hypothetical protein [Bacillus sp. (in: firmicutes)]